MNSGLPHKAKKRFGQNFLHDPMVIQRIIQVINPRSGEHLVEIGPGQGAITRELLRAAGKLDAIELDRDLLHQLATECGHLGELNIINADALRFDFCSLATDDRPLRLVGNLPYNISTPILFHLMGHAGCIRDMHFMLQKEVVDRMAAGPGSKTYGRLSVMMQAWCRIDPLFEIGPGAFKPAPKVDSAIVRLIPYDKAPYPVDDSAYFAGLVAAAFSQRRKTLRNSLRQLVSRETMEAAGIDPASRAERLSLEDFTRLSNLACKTPPPA
ncbi:MAG: 16S rRNA (adenine(1518)-N(6)/adenine(1519)-N(6))-dimethyltransferase RsmA [Sedimenticola sp.]|nr:16S rRNA (adenine(1518)-N(6)/adenine(1519)-N(6))-dimethyltransferase RsmA [Sedimenticola sp.]